MLITFCIRCRVRLHRTRALRHWVPEPLLELWRELNPASAMQYQLPLALLGSRLIIRESRTILLGFYADESPHLLM
jgi:hypothetical protein